MNLFKTLLDVLSKNCDVTIVVRKTGDQNLTVSTLLRNDDTTDPARDAISPFVVTGTADELDAEYADLIKAPMEKSSGIQTSMANFEASAKAAQASSKAAAESKRKETDAKKSAKASVAKILASADTLLKEKKYADAKALYNKAKDAAVLAELTAEKAAAQKGIDTCSKNEAPDIFSAFGEAEAETDPEEQTTKGQDASGEEETEASEEEETIDPLAFGE